MQGLFFLGLQVKLEVPPPHHSGCHIGNLLQNQFREGPQELYIQADRARDQNEQPGEGKADRVESSYGRGFEGLCARTLFDLFDKSIECFGQFFRILMFSGSLTAMQRFWNLTVWCVVLRWPVGSTLRVFS